MTVLEVLVGGGLAFAGSAAGQAWQAHRDAVKDRSAATDAAQVRRRELLIEVQDAVTGAVLPSIEIGQTGKRQLALADWTRSLARLQSLACRLEPQDLRDLVLQYALGVAQAGQRSAIEEAACRERFTAVSVRLGEELRAIER